MLKIINQKLPRVCNLSIFILFVLFFLESVDAAIAQNIARKPIRIDKLQTAKLPIPPGVSILEATYYEFLVAPDGRITVKLLDDSTNPIARFEVQELIAERALIYTISENDKSEWMRIQSKEFNDTISYSAITSAGTEMSLDVLIDKSNKNGKLRVKEISLATELGRKSFFFAGSNLTESRMIAQDAMLTEEQKLFSTASLRKLQLFIQNFGSLKDATLKKWTHADEEKTIFGDKQKDIVFNYFEPVTCSGSATCYRISTIIPIFNCIGNCWGIYIVYDCVVNIICTQRCSDLNGCA